MAIKKTMATMRNQREKQSTKAEDGMKPGLEDGEKLLGGGQRSQMGVAFSSKQTVNTTIKESNQSTQSANAINNRSM